MPDNQWLNDSTCAGAISRITVNMGCSVGNEASIGGICRREVKLLWAKSEKTIV